MAKSVAITAAGMVTSLGGMLQACAAIRAGITQVKPLRHFTTLDPDTQEPAPLIGHPITGVTDGFGPTARWLTMSRYALQDLKSGLTGDQLAAVAWARTGVIFVLPVLDDARFFYAPAAQANEIWASCLDPLLSAEALRLSAAHRELVSIGAAGLGRAVELAGGWLEAGGVSRVLVIAVDSLVDAWSLHWLADGRRLKDAENPVGLAPGEAAVAVLLEAEGKGEGAALGVVRGVAFEEVDEPFQNFERRKGVGLARSLRRLTAGTSRRLEGDVLVNLNGEEWRAAEFGAALSALAASERGAYKVIAPAISIGDVGAAAGAVQLACALRSFGSGYATGTQAWVLATSDYGDVSTLNVEAA